MEDADIERLRRDLLTRRGQLLELAESSRESTRTVELDQSSVGRLSRMDAMQSQQMARELARRRERELVAIDGALRRIETGDFGYCFVCGEEIGVARLSVDATMTRCIGCASSTTA